MAETRNGEKGNKKIQTEKQGVNVLLINIKGMNFSVGGLLTNTANALDSAKVGGDGSSTGGFDTSGASTNASTAAASGGEEEAAAGGGLMSYLPMIVIWGGFFVLIYLMMFRPQRKQQKRLAEMRGALKVGDNIVTNSGLFGKIVEVGTDAHVVEFGSNRGVRIPVLKSEIAGVKEPVLTPPPVKS